MSIQYSFLIMWSLFFKLSDNFSLNILKKLCPTQPDYFLDFMHFLKELLDNCLFKFSKMLPKKTIKTRENKDFYV